MQKKKNVYIYSVCDQPLYANHYCAVATGTFYLIRCNSPCSHQPTVITDQPTNYRTMVEGRAVGGQPELGVPAAGRGRGAGVIPRRRLHFAGDGAGLAGHERGEHGGDHGLERPRGRAHPGDDFMNFVFRNVVLFAGRAFIFFLVLGLSAEDKHKTLKTKTKQKTVFFFVAFLCCMVRCNRAMPMTSIL